MVKARLLFQAEDADRLQQAQRAHGVYISGVLGALKTDGHMGLCAQVVDFIGLRLLHNAHQVAGVGQVAIVQLEIGILNMRVLVDVVDALGVEGAGAALDAVHHITFLQQQLRQIRSILAGNAGDQCDFGCGTGACIWHKASNGAVGYRLIDLDSRRVRPCTILGGLRISMRLPTKKLPR